MIATDNAGNIEATPPGVELPPLSAIINLGTLPSVTSTPQVGFPVATPPSPTPANALFIQAKAAIPETQTGGSDFTTVITPFETGAFATGIGTSNDNVGALGLAFSPDGSSVYATGGANRNQLFVFSRAGGVATPLATLSVPIYDLTFDASGQLWATTGGGATRSTRSQDRPGRRQLRRRNGTRPCRQGQPALHLHHLRHRNLQHHHARLRRLQQHTRSRIGHCARRHPLGRHLADTGTGRQVRQEWHSDP